MKLRNKIFICLIMDACSTMTACKSKTEDKQAEDFTVKGDTVIVSASDLQKKLLIEEAKKQDYRLQIASAATVMAIPNQYAKIAPPFAGRILRSFVQLGQKVNAESPLFEISAPDFTDAQKLYFQAKFQYELSQQTLKRQQDLLKHGVGTQKDEDEAETNFQIQKKEYENAVAGIRVFKVDPATLSLGQPLIVKSPIHGTVISNKIVVGQFLKDASDPVAEVAELSKVWISGQVKEKDIRFIQTGDEAIVELVAYPGDIIKGKAYHVNEYVDDDTKAIQVLVVCDNQQQKLKPGMYASVKFIEPPQQSILVPAKSLLQDADRSYVFVQTGAGKFVRRYVETGGTDISGKVVILSGLQQDEKIIAEGGFYLAGAK